MTKTPAKRLDSPAMPSTKKRKRNAQAKAQSGKISKFSDAFYSSSNSLDIFSVGRKLSSIFSDEELELRIETLRTLTAFPNVIKSKPCKDLSAVVFDFRLACTTSKNAVGITVLGTSRTQ